MQSIKRVHVIINPASGQDKPILNVLNRVFGSQVEWTLSITKESGDARRETLAALELGVDLVVACGGDGTVMEVANGLLGQSVPLAILPAGTANVMAVELGIPRDIEGAAKLIVSADTVLRDIDVGEVDDTVFLLRMGVGLEAVLIRDADREFKQRYGNLAYPISAVRSVLTTDSTAHYRITVDGETHEADGITCMIANSANVGLAGVTVSQAVHIDDGLLDVVLLRALDQPPPEENVTDELRPDPLLLQWQGRDITVEADPPQPIICDGEPRGETPLSVRVRPQALTVLVPAVAVKPEPEANGVSVREALTPDITLSRLRNPLHLLLELVDRVVRFFRGAPVHKYSEIAPGLLIGGQHTERGTQAMADRGVTASINLRSESDDARLNRALGRHLHLPVIDGMEPTQEQLKEGVDFITQEIEDGGAVYVHCNLGIGRAPTLAAAYLMSTGVSLPEAWERIREKRPFVRPTRRQIDALRTFGDSL
jgi:YegS/Rv2252/BmrU family lipid kinase